MKYLLCILVTKSVIMYIIIIYKKCYYVY